MSEQLEGEHTVEADSPRIHNDGLHRTELWSRCYPTLVEEAERRITQEVHRLGGSCAHVLDETITVKVDDASGTFGLHGVFSYMLYVHPQA